MQLNKPFHNRSGLFYNFNFNYNREVMDMKRAISILLVMVMVLGVFAACKKEGEDSPTPKPTNTPASTAEPTPTEEPTPSPSPAPGTNVALNKPFEVSSETDSTYVQWGWYSEYINDGVIEHDQKLMPAGHLNQSVHVTGGFRREWVWIDLQGVISIDKVMLYPRQDNGACFPMDYYIEVSTDNENFEKVAEVTGDDRSREEIKEPAILTFEPVDARYVRLVVTKPFEVPSGSDGYLVQLAEFEIYAAPSS